MFPDQAGLRQGTLDRMILKSVAPTQMRGPGIARRIGLLSYDVTRRPREWGIRTALGAEGSAVLGLVIRRGLVLSAIGTAIGVVISVARRATRVDPAIALWHD
jgi:hypothetical protein